MTDDDRIRAIIFALADWRDEMAEIEKGLQVEGLTREQRLILEGDKVVMAHRIRRASTLVSTYDMLGLGKDGRDFFAREIGESIKDLKP